MKNYHDKGDSNLPPLTALRTFEVAAKHMSFSYQDIDTNQLSWRHFNNYIIAIDAAEHGQGIAMGWHSLISKSLQQGKLVPFRDFSISTPGAFCLTWPEDVALNHDAECFRRWLVDSQI